MKYLLLLVSLFTGEILFAQTFPGGTGSIPDYNGIAHPTYFACPVSGLASTIDSIYGIERVCINITHTYDGDLRIELMSPDSTMISLCWNHGGGGDNFVSTCFRGQGADGLISAGTPPFTGEFDPDGDLSTYNDGRNPNGNWFLIVTDMAGNDTGSVTSWHIDFGLNPTPHILMPCNVNDPTACLCPDGTQDCDLLPDMTASRREIQNDNNETAGRLYIGNATPNIGWGPLEINGINVCYCDTTQVPCTTDSCPGTGLPPKQLVNQRIYHKNHGIMTTWDRPAGTMTYHPSHGHIHLDNWASYTLRRPVYGLDTIDWPIIGTGNKQSYCLVNLGDCTGNAGFCVDSNGNTLTMANIPNAGLGQVTGCGTSQGIYVGKLDIYSSGLNGQWIDLNNVCNGDYFVVSITDPLNVILETNENNNWTAVPVTLTQQLNMTFPTVNFTYAAFGNTITFYNSSSNYDSLAWDFGDGAVTRGVNPIHSYLGTGDFTIILSCYNQCGMTQQVVTVTFTPTGISSIPTDDVFGFTVAPNPFSSQAKIDFRLSRPTNVDLRLYDAVGREIVILTSGLHSAGTFSTLLDAETDHLERGVYTLRLTSADKIISKRIVLMK